MTSARVAHRLRAAGFARAFGLRGGLEEWQAAGGPVEPREGAG